MPIKIREVDRVSILDIEGNIDINSSDIVETVGWLLNSGKLFIILNLENVDMIDYSGLSILAIAYKNTVNHKGKLKFLNTSLSVQELFRVVKLDVVFETYSDEESALKSFYDEGAEKLNLRRRFKRLDMHIPIKYNIVSDQKTPKIFAGEILNISAAGIYVYSPYLLPINSVLKLDFHLSGQASAVETEGRVIWHGDKDLQLHWYPGMGVAFIHLAPEKEKIIVDFIDRNVSYRAESI